MEKQNVLVVQLLFSTLLLKGTEFVISRLGRVLFLRNYVRGLAITPETLRNRIDLDESIFFGKILGKDGELPSSPRPFYAYLTRQKAGTPDLVNLRHSPVFRKCELECLDC